MPKAYVAMRNKFAKGAKEDSPEYNAAQSKAAALYNKRHPGQPMSSGDDYEKSKKRRKRKPFHGDR